MAAVDPLSRRPLPTKLVLLDEVAQQESGTKIRVLGCVHEYRAARALLVLKSRYPAVQQPSVLADIRCVLAKLNHETVAVGSWINIVGVVRQTAQRSTDVRSTRAPSTTTALSAPIAANPSNVERARRRKRRIRPPVVEVTMIWSAGAINLAAYESAARDYARSDARPD